VAKTKLVTLHNTKRAAEAARANLISAGFDGDSISIDDKETIGDAKPGVFKHLFGSDIEEYEAHTYAKAIKDGHYLLSIQVDDADASKALHVLNRHKNVDVKTHAVKSGVLTAKAAATVALPTYSSEYDAIDNVLDATETLKLAEEHVHVDKRVVETGTTAVRRYTVEEPVTATVKLHDEHVRIVKRALDDPNYDDIDWGDATIELRSSKEVPYVTKSAKVVAEVGLEKIGSDHKETIHDTERKEKYEIITEPARIEELASYDY